MPIIVYCQKCGKKNRAPDAAGGKQGRCAACREVMDIPLQDEPPPLPEDDEPPPLPDDEIKQEPVESDLPPPMPVSEQPEQVASAQPPPFPSSLKKMKNSAKVALSLLLAIPAGFLLIFLAGRDPHALRSRMAMNQTTAAESCKAYAEAQEIYHRTDYDRDGILEYAQAMKGDYSLQENRSGARDLLLIFPAIAEAEGPPSKLPTPSGWGYCYKILKSQGKFATGGARSYMEGQNMTLGYALVCYPAKYDSDGRDCFIINNTGVIFQADLGPDTHAI